MTATIRRATAADGPGVYRAWQAFREHNASMDSRIMPTPVSEGEFVAGLGDVLANSGRVIVVAIDGTALVGFGTAQVIDNQPDRLPERHVTVGYLYTAPSHRRRGLGRELYGAITEWAARQDGVSHIEMPVLAGDADAAAFWRSLGFTPFIERLWAPLNVNAGEDGG